MPLRARGPTRWHTLFACIVAALTSGFCYSFGIYSGALKRQLGLSQSQLAWIGTAGNLMFPLSPVAGWVTDVRGPRVTQLAGGVAMSTGLLLQYGLARKALAWEWSHTPAGATLLLSPHGAHLTNTLWASRGATLLEVMPWGMWHYEGYKGLFKSGGIAVARISSARPPPGQPHWQRDGGATGGSGSGGSGGRRGKRARAAAAAQLQEHDQERCSLNEDCRRFYRRFADLYFGEAEICAALRLSGWQIWYEPALCIRHFIPAGRLNWDYLTRLNTGFGKQSVYLDAYYALLPGFTRGKPARPCWIHESLKALRALAGLFPQVGFRSAEQLEGNAAWLVWKNQCARLKTLWQEKGDYARRFHRIATAPWNQGKALHP